MTISTNGITKFLVITAIGSMLIGSGVAYGFEIFKGEDAQIRGLDNSQVVKLKTFGPSDGLSPGDTVLSFKATKSTTTSIVNTRGAIYDSSNNLLGSSNIITLPPSGSGVVEFTMTTPVTVPPNGIVQVMMNNDRVIGWNGGGIGAIVFDQETFPTIPDPWKQSTELGNNGIRCTGCSIDITLVVADAPPNQDPDCSEAVASTDTIWPPNHKFVSISIDGVSDSDGDSVSVTIDGIEQDELVDEKGDGKTSPDGDGVGTDTAEVRAERSGTGDGRIYEISFTADDGNGGSCDGSVIVGVPHDKKSDPIDSEVRYNSTS